jgi:hypothetical protein
MRMSAGIWLLMLRYFLFPVWFGLGLGLPVHAAKTTLAPVAQEESAAATAAEPPSEAPADPAPAKSPSKITGTYSTLKSVGGEDDMIGIEVILVRSREGFRAFVQTADGVPGTPVLVPVNVDGATLSFPIPSATGELVEFKGKATRQGLSGTLKDRPLTLPRRRSYWQWEVSACEVSPPTASAQLLGVS